MYISKVIIRNFRVFDSKGITASFKKGINAIIGENNCGKSALVDALRIAFSTTSYRKEIYFNLSDFHIDSRGIRSDEAFIDVYFDEVPADFFEIWDPEDNTKGEFHIKYYSVRLPDGKEKIRYQIWGGPVEGNNLSSETLESIKTVYLSALRDSENELKPTRSGKLANLLSSIVNTDEAKEQILAAVKLANANIEGQQSVVQLQNIINTNLSVLEQDLLRQKVGVGLVEPKFESIDASLRAWLRPRWIYIKSDNPILEKVKGLYSDDEWRGATDSDTKGVFVDVWTTESKTLTDEIKEALSTELNKKFEIMQNGLGYNNLLFMAAVLGDIEAATAETLFSLLLVEEPEAHLHPQLQELVHSFFEKNSNNENVQVIYTSHSPTLISRIGIDKIVLLFENKHRIDCLSLSESNLDNKDRYYLERYLDVTKSQMLFAKGIIFVEGICEALILPCLAKIIDRPFDKYAVLNENELKFVKALQKHITMHADHFMDKELYLIRNRSKKGIGFFDDAGFYPDFILWMIADGKQYITFINPHGMGRESISSSKVQLYNRLKIDVESKLTVPSVALNSFILSPTKPSELADKNVTIEEWNTNHVLFMDDNDYIEKLFTGITG